MEYLTLEDVLGMIRRAGLGPVQDVGLLASAVGRPRASAFGRDAYPDLATKAASLLHSLARNHALVDGNKRIAMLATWVFIDINGHRPDLSHDEAFDLVMAVSEGALEVPAIGMALRLMPARR